MTAPPPYLTGAPFLRDDDGAIEWPAPDPTSVFFLRGPAMISFSGGRTSALMLFAILWAHGGTLPPDVHVMFANTGKEREETLRFVHECGVRWGVRIIWVEWRPPPARHRKGDAKVALKDDGARRIEIVGYNSADRTGKWFAELIRRKQYLPNVDMRYCTQLLKIEAMKWAMIAMGYTHWLNVVGLRADEMHRVMKQVLRNGQDRERFVSTCPLARAGITKRTVLRFWLGRNIDPRALRFPLPQGFDLGLRDYEGNCDVCFLKGRGKKAQIIRDVPGSGEWWAEQEALATRRTFVKTAYAKLFDKRESMVQLMAAVEASPELTGFVDDDDRDYDVACGDSCIGDRDDEPIGDDAIEWIMEQMERAQAQPIAMPEVRMKAAPAVGDLFDIGEET